MMSESLPWARGNQADAISWRLLSIGFKSSICDTFLSVAVEVWSFDKKSVTSV